MSKPSGLPPVPGQEPKEPEKIEKEDTGGLTGLPDAQPGDQAPPSVQAGRICKQCGREARVVSNAHGVQAYCNPCKIDWPISSSAMAPTMPNTLPRGIRKQTLVEPDWSKAYED